jgi:hypothetical protein
MVHSTLWDVSFPTSAGCVHMGLDTCVHVWEGLLGAASTRAALEQEARNVRCRQGAMCCQLEPTWNP